VRLIVDEADAPTEEARIMMYGGWGGWGWMTLMPLLWIALIGVIVWAVVRLTAASVGADGSAAGVAAGDPGPALRRR
jgi:putative membrane protein